MTTTECRRFRFLVICTGNRAQSQMAQVLRQLRDEIETYCLELLHEVLE